jgi:hypothetical protein
MYPLALGPLAAVRTAPRHAHFMGSGLGVTPGARGAAADDGVPSGPLPGRPTWSPLASHARPVRGAAAARRQVASMRAHTLTKQLCFPAPTLHAIFVLRSCAIVGAPTRTHTLACILHAAPPPSPRTHTGFELLSLQPIAPELSHEARRGREWLGRWRRVG